ncbi:hypothetical protein ABH11_02192 [Serratia marcescens]|uniref:DUF551 domain-containing protein n=1 Tax=Serratia marcescens TaxID=615 RepID=UPI0006CB4846|nr:DUF551 domain-containing protein [Serratia marcescens]ALE96522.1 hypothetical protein ABH11_02192 [Serratia marcescens]
MLTTEQLRALRDALKSWQDCYDLTDDKEQYEMFVTAETAVGELLANREAQPVAIVESSDYVTAAQIAGDEPRSKAVKELYEGALVIGQHLYTAPPAPAVPDNCQHLKSVQELYHSQEGRLFELAQRIKGASFDKYSHSTAQAIDVLEREIFGDDGDACRAAMLAQPVSSSYKLPEGWIVCSEQTPVADGAYWCWFGKEKPSVIQQRVCIWNDRNHEWCDSAVTHWMPLPAAPEGGK